MNRVLFSISVAYILPILISVSVEYQLPIPRPPMSRLPTALTSSMLPGLTLDFLAADFDHLLGIDIGCRDITLQRALFRRGRDCSCPCPCPSSCACLSCRSCRQGTQSACIARLRRGVFLESLASGWAGVSPATGAVPGAGWAEAVRGVVVPADSPAGWSEPAGRQWIGRRRRLRRGLRPRGGGHCQCQCR